MVAAAARVTPQTVKTAVQGHTKIDPKVASLMVDPHFPSTLDVARLTREVNLLQQARLLPTSFQITSMIVPLPAAN
jgi:hypothetical protein